MLIPKPTIVLTLLLLIFGSCNDPDTSPTPNNAASEELQAVFDEFQKNYNNPSQAYELLTRVKTLAEEEGNQEYLAKYYAGLGYLKHVKQQYNDAILAYQQALPIYKSLGDSLRQGWILNNLGDIYRVSFMPEQAFEYFSRTEAIYQSIDRQDKLLGLYENFTLIYLDGKLYDIAQEYIDKGMYQCKETEDPYWKYNFHNLQGKLHLGKKDYALARNSFIKALGFIESIRDTEKAYAYGNIGETYLLEKNPDAAEEWIAKAMEAKKIIENADIRPNLNYLGIYQAQKGNYTKALDLFDQVVRLSEDDLLEKELGVAIENSNDIYNNQPNLRTDESFKRTLYYSNILRKSNELLLELQDQLKILYNQSLVKKGEADFADIEEQKQIAKDKAITHMLYGGLIALSIVFLFSGTAYYRKRLKKLREERVKIQEEQEKYKVENDKYKKCTKAIQEAIAESGVA